MSGSVAATIQGEAGSDPANQFAVASVIYNRIQAGTFPGGSNAFAVVNAPSQFIGSASPNSSAQQFADAIENGTLGQYGTTGNALYFQTAGSATTLGSNPNAVNIGGNNYSDEWGSPSSSFVAPSYGGGAAGSDGNPNTFTGSNGNLDVGGGGDIGTPGYGGSYGGGLDPGALSGTGPDPTAPAIIPGTSNNPVTQAQQALPAIGAFVGNWAVRLGLIAVGIVLIGAAAVNLAKEHDVGLPMLPE